MKNCKKYSSPRSRYGMCCLMGLLGSAGFAQYNITAMFLLSFAYLFAKIICNKDKHRNFAWSTFWFSVFFYASNLYWLAFPLTLDFRTHGILIPVALILIPSFLSLQIIVAAFVTRKYFHTIHQQALAFPAIIGVMLYIFGHFPIEFPWILPGYAWCCHEVFLQTLSIYGIYGLSVITMSMITSMGASYVFYNEGKVKSAAIALALSLLLLLGMSSYGLMRLHNHQTKYTNIRAGVVQCNLSQEEKNDESLDYANLLRHLHSSNLLNFSEKSKEVDFIIWPEASIPYLYRDDMVALNARLRSILPDKSYLIAGTVREDVFTAKTHNSAIIIGHDKNILKYDKIHLVPFGEYIPCRKYLPAQISSIASNIGDFDVGCAPKILQLKELSIILCICYECVFPLEFIPKNAKGCPDVENVDLMINLTNDAWFGQTSEPFQHLQICRSRAIECGIPLIRAANFGISAIFDGYGIELASIAINTAGTINAFVPKKIPGGTIYAKYGDTIFWIMVLLLLATAIFVKYVGSIAWRSIE
ncbi:MAG: apolipoprotein N-acyltransferase [Holosporaceae bacterium]|nr:apolipoprotein N-acyltransferase [Holosporaceae bacterium]